MARQTISGVSGVLGGLISEPLNVSNKHRDSRKSDTKSVKAESEKIHRRSKVKSRARLGRPPGCRPQPKRPKEKLTIRIDARLAHQYRDWSWDQRCQLGELIERALEDFYSRR